MILQVDENLGTLGQVQMFCDTLRQQSSNYNYSPLHLAVELDLKNVISDSQIEAFINARDSQGMLSISYTHFLHICSTYSYTLFKIIKILHFIFFNI